ncbi:unnamed protein product [Orchesella dallaii]|uniref:Uncharacterized protein n=1 Tax=Orchesella dallaii TaxID=48710 RepID=A0ABP1Q0G8_9HEXA
MKDYTNQLWLTSALSDDDVPGALTLCFSLRKVLTSRKVAVIYSRKVTRALREALNFGFDYVFCLEDDRNTAGLKDEEFVKLFALTLKSFEKCAMLSPNMLVLKNCDELLDDVVEEVKEKERIQQQLVWTKNGDTSIFLLRPSIPIFMCLMEALRHRNGTGVDHFLKTWIVNQMENVKFLDDKYNRALSSNKGFLLGQCGFLTRNTTTANQPSTTVKQ